MDVVNGLSCVFLVITASCGRFGFPALSAPSDSGSGADSSADAAASDASLLTVLPSDAEFLPIANNIAFVSSTVPTVASLGSVTGADSLCNSLAMAAKLPGTYVAWLSSSSRSIVQRFGAARGWVRPDGRPIADTLSDLASGAIRYPIVLNEFKERVPAASARVMTGTTVRGPTTLVADANCIDLSSTSSSEVIVVGDAAGGTMAFTDRDRGLCDSAARIYCFGKGNVAPLRSFPSASARVAFLSSLLRSGGGIEAADAVCGADARAAGLRGAYKALLATKSASAASRFNLDGPPWVRPDGVVIARSARALMDGQLEAPITITAAGQPSLDTRSFESLAAWSGAPTPYATATMNCDDWRDSGAALIASVGEMVASPGFFSVEGVGAICNARRPVYCLEE